MSKVFKGLKYEFCSGDGDSGNDLFLLKQDNEGRTKIYTKVPIDYEAYSAMASPYVTVRIKCTDERRKSFEKKIQINILDVEEVPPKLNLDVVLVGPGGGAGGQDAGNGGPGGSGSQYSFSFEMTKDRTYAIKIGSGGKGGLSSGSVSWGSSGGESGDFSGEFYYAGGKGGYAGPTGSSGGGGGGGSVSALLYKYMGRKGMGSSRKVERWAPAVVAGGGAGGTGRRELPAHPGKAADHVPFVPTDEDPFHYKGGDGFENSGDGPGGGGGGGGIKGGLGATTSDGAYGGSSGIAEVPFSDIFINRNLLRGRTGAVNASSDFHYHGHTTRTQIAAMTGKWWNGIMPLHSGTGGYSGATYADRSFSNGSPGAAIIRYKSTSLGGFPRLKFGGSYQLLDGYHVHTYSEIGFTELSMELYE